MKIICNRSTLNANLALVSRAVSSRPSHIILSNLLLVTDKDNSVVTLTGFDLSLGIKTNFEADILEDGIITIPAKLITDIVSKFSGGTVTLSLREIDISSGDESKIESYVLDVICDNSKFEISCISAAEFPKLPEIKEVNRFTLPADVLLSGIKSTVFASSTDESKQILTGVHVECKENILEFAATDGRRLAVAGGISSPTDTQLNVTIPSHSLKELERILSNYQPMDAVLVSFNSSIVSFEIGNQVLISRLLDGDYPLYRRLIPSVFDKNITLLRKGLLNSLDLISVFATSNNNTIKFTIDKENSQVVLSSQSKDMGSAEDFIPCLINCESMDVGLNIKYLTEALKSLNSDQVIFSLNGEGQMIIISSCESSESFSLIAPVDLKR